MSFEDVMKNFDEIAICHMHPDAMSTEMITDDVSNVQFSSNE